MMDFLTTCAGFYFSAFNLILNCKLYCAQLGCVHLHSQQQSWWKLNRTKVESRSVKTRWLGLGSSFATFWTVWLSVTDNVSLYLSSQSENGSFSNVTEWLWHKVRCLVLVVSGLWQYLCYTLYFIELNYSTPGILCSDLCLGVYIFCTVNLCKPHTLGDFAINRR